LPTIHFKIDFYVGSVKNTDGHSFRLIFYKKDFSVTHTTICRTFWLFSLFSIFFIGSNGPAKASDDLLSIGVGYYDINDNEDAADFRLEYRWDKPLFWGIEPWVGAEVSTDGAIYGLGGLLADIQVGDNFLITPSFGAGLYEDGDGKDLGNTIQFRSQIELGWEFDNASRLGVAFGHISNAGLDNRNPGTEILNLYYHVPVGDVF